MMPGVTHLPLASITWAPAGAFTVAPTALILPFSSRTAPLAITGPAAVRIVALRMTVGRDGNGWYVDAYGFVMRPVLAAAGCGFCAAATGACWARGSSACAIIAAAMTSGVTIRKCIKKPPGG